MKKKRPPAAAARKILPFCKGSQIFAILRPGPAAGWSRLAPAAISLPATGGVWPQEEGILRQLCCYKYDGGSALMLAMWWILQVKVGAGCYQLACNGGRVAPRRRHLEAALLLQMRRWLGADVGDVVDEFSALMLAMCNGHIDTAGKLVGAGAKLDLESEDGALLLQMRRWLGADVGDVVDEFSALMLVMCNGHIDTAGKLVGAGAKLDLESEDGDSALMRASIRHLYTEGDGHTHFLETSVLKEDEDAMMLKALLGEEDEDAMMLKALLGEENEDVLMLKALLGEEDQDADTNSYLGRAAFASRGGAGAVHTDG